MKISNTQLKKCGVLFAAMTFFSSSAAFADANTDRLLAAILAKSTEISNKTSDMLDAVNKIPAYIFEITKMATSWNQTKETNNNVMSDNQYAFAQLNSTYGSGLDAQLDATQQLTRDFIQAGSLRENAPLPPNANDLSYPILLGKQIAPAESKNTDQNAKNYLKNLAGMSMVLLQPDPIWVDGRAKSQYQSFYNTMISIQSYNAFIINGLNKQKESDTLDKTLMDQASNSDWFVHVSSEPLGMVLRQILMYNSQTYVQLTRMYKLQQQQLTTQAMTNTLLLIQLQQTVGEMISMKAKQNIK